MGLASCFLKAFYPPPDFLLEQMRVFFPFKNNIVVNLSKHNNIELHFTICFKTYNRIIILETVVETISENLLLPKRIEMQ